MASLNEEVLRVANIAYEWGYCRTIDEQIALFKRKPDCRQVFIALNRNLVALTNALEYNDAKSAFNMMEMDQKASVLTSTALNHPSKQAVRLLSFVSNEEAVATLLRVHQLGA